MKCLPMRLNLLKFISLLFCLSVFSVLGISADSVWPKPLNQVR